MDKELQAAMELTADDLRAMREQARPAAVAKTPPATRTIAAIISSSDLILSHLIRSSNGRGPTRIPVTRVISREVVVT